MAYLEYYNTMNKSYDASSEDESDANDQSDRMAEYEQKLLQTHGKPQLAAMFLLYFVISSALISILVYFFF